MENSDIRKARKYEEIEQIVLQSYIEEEQEEIEARTKRGWGLLNLAGALLIVLFFILLAFS